MTIFLGLDLAIRTGSLVKIEVDPQTKLIVRYKVLQSWVKGPRSKQGLSYILSFFKEHVYPQISTGSAVGIDWSPREIFYGPNKKVANQKTFVAGHLFRHCEAQGVIPIFIPPERVRAFFGYNSRTSKLVVQREFHCVPRLGAWTYDTNLTEHDMDALILAYVLSQTFKT